MSEALSETIADRTSEIERRKAYRELPEIKAAIARSAQSAAGGETMASWFLYETGKKLQLDVEVIDPQVAQVLLGSAFSDSPLMPGFKVKNIRFDDLERKDVVKAWLQHQLDTLERPHGSNLFFQSNLLDRCRLTDEEAKRFKDQANQECQRDESTGAVVVCYVHPDGRILIDAVRVAP